MSEPRFSLNKRRQRGTGPLGWRWGCTQCRAEGWEFLAHFASKEAEKHMKQVHREV